MRRMTRREWLGSSARFAAAAALAPTLSSCRRAGRGETDVRRSSVTILYPYDEFVLGLEDDMPARFLMFLPLVSWNARGELEGRLAESWEDSPDYRTWTIRLRDGVRWHDGVPVTAHDVKFSLDLLMHPDVLWNPPGSFFVDIIDDLTYKIVRNGPSFAGTPLDDWAVYYPKHRLERLDPKDYVHWQFWTEPVGNGPYRHVRTVPKTMMEFEANPDYLRGTPKIAKVILKFGDPGGGGAVPELISGDVDAATWVRPADLLTFEGDDRFARFEQPFDDLATVLLWNHRHALFDEARVRRALTLAINRRELLEVLNLGPQTPILDAPPAKRLFRLRQLPAAIPYDPEAANRLLDRAGWHERDGSRVRVRDGKPFKFTAITSRLFAQDAAAIYIQAQLRRVGVSMDILVLEEINRFRRAVTADYEAAVCNVFLHWGPGNNTERFLNSAGYNVPRFRELAERMGTPLSPDDEDRTSRELTELFQQDVPATFLYPDILTTVAGRRIRGLDRTPYSGDLTWCMDQLWLEDNT